MCNLFSSLYNTFGMYICGIHFELSLLPVKVNWKIKKKNNNYHCKIN